RVARARRARRNIGLGVCDQPKEPAAVRAVAVLRFPFAGLETLACERDRVLGLGPAHRIFRRDAPQHWAGDIGGLPRLGADGRGPRSHVVQILNEVQFGAATGSITGFLQRFVDRAPSLRPSADLPEVPRTPSREAGGWE